MDTRRSIALVVILCAFAIPSPVQAQVGISLAIDKHARLSEQGGAIIRIRIACGPFPGFEDFQEGFAGAFQANTGAEAEGGFDGMVICDGIARTHTAHLSSFVDAVFKRGPAAADASLFVCTVVEDEQICFQGSTQRRVIIRGRLVPLSQVP